MSKIKFINIKLIKIFLVFICISANTFLLQAQLPKLIPYYQNGKWGYSDSLQNIVIPCEYETVRFFKNGFAVVTGNCENVRNPHYSGGWCGTGNYEFNLVCKVGVIDKKGNVIIPLEFDNIEDFNENGIAKATRGGEVVFLDTIGNKITSFIETMPSTHSNRDLNLLRNSIEQNLQRSEKSALNLTKFQKNGKFGVRDSVGREIIPSQYDQVIPFENGFIAVQIDGLWGIRNLRNAEIVPIEFGNIEFFGVNLNDSGQRGVNKTDFIKVRKNGRWGLLSKDGKGEIIPARYNSVYVFSDNLFFANDRYNIIFYNNQGKQIATIRDHDRIENGELDYLNLSLRVNQYPSLIRTDEGFIDIYGNTYFENKCR